MYHAFVSWSERMRKILLKSSQENMGEIYVCYFYEQDFILKTSAYLSLILRSTFFQNLQLLCIDFVLDVIQLLDELKAMINSLPLDQLNVILKRLFYVKRSIL